MSRKIASHYALVDGRLERDRVLTLADDGTIVDIVESHALDAMAGVEFYPGILLPGMVNAHCHLELSYLAGAIAEGTGFAGFAREIGRIRSLFSDEQRLRAATLADAKLWAEGVEAVVDIANDSLIMSVKERSKIKYLTLFELFGLKAESADTLRQMVARATTAASITPHSTYSVQDGIFREIASCGDAPLSIHLLESRAESELYHRRGSLWEWYERMGWECDFLHYGTPARRIVESIPSDRRTLLVHGCEATAEDIELIEGHFHRRATWVLCPESNRYISSAKAPAQLLHRMGAAVAIGSDSLASARTLSLIDNMRLIEGIPLETLLNWATRGGAEALGMGDSLGTLAIGRRPGIVLLEGADLHNLKLTADSHTRRLL